MPRRIPQLGVIAFVALAIGGLAWLRKEQSYQLSAARAAAQAARSLYVARLDPPASDSLAGELRQASLVEEEFRLDALLCESLPKGRPGWLFLLSSEDREEFGSSLKEVASYRSEFASPYAQSTWYVLPDETKSLRQERANVERAMVRLVQFSDSDLGPQPNPSFQRTASRPLN